MGKLQTKSAKPKPPTPHGTWTRYSHGCRCRRCTKAAREYQRDYRSRKVENKNLTHGTRSSYINGCRCAPCTRANSDYIRDWKRDSKAA